jgi:DNA repair protein RadC
MDNAVSIYNYMHPRMQDLYQEEAWALLLNQHLRLIKAVRISQGGITETAIDVRVVMREALLANATVVALCHNHPSGNIKPSRQDDGVTEKVRKACETMRLHLLDHVIVTDGAYYSYQEQGRL